MFKKFCGGILAGIMIFNITFSTFALGNTESNDTIDIEKLISVELTPSLEKQIEHDISVLNKCGQSSELLFDIDIEEKGYIYKFKYDNDLISEVILTENKDGTLELDITEGEKHNILFIGKDEVSIDGKEVEFTEVTSTEIFNDESSSIMPLADRDVWVLTTCPYGVKADYNNLIKSVKVTNIALSNKLRNIAIGTLAGVFMTYAVGPAAGMLATIGTNAASALASEVMASFETYNTTNGLSLENFIYYHKNGHYINSKSMYVQKNNIRWYPNIGLRSEDKSKSKVIPTYTCTKYY